MNRQFYVFSFVFFFFFCITLEDETCFKKKSSFDLRTRGCNSGNLFLKSTPSLQNLTLYHGTSESTHMTYWLWNIPDVTVLGQKELLLVNKMFFRDPWISFPLSSTIPILLLPENQHYEVGESSSNVVICINWSLFEGYGDMFKWDTVAVEVIMSS